MRRVPASLVAISTSNRDIVVVICAAEDSRRDVFEGWSVRLIPRAFHAAPTVTTPPVLRLGHAVAKLQSKASCPTNDPTRVLSPGQLDFAFALVRNHLSYYRSCRIGDKLVDRAPGDAELLGRCGRTDQSGHVLDLMGVNRSRAPFVFALCFGLGEALLRSPEAF